MQVSIEARFSLTAAGYVLSVGSIVGTHWRLNPAVSETAATGVVAARVEIVVETGNDSA
jgi:hypothetical protein